MKKLTDKIEAFLEWGGTRREVVLLVISGAALLASIFELAPLPFDPRTSPPGRWPSSCSWAPCWRT